MLTETIEHHHYLDQPFNTRQKAHLKKVEYKNNIGQEIK